MTLWPVFVKKLQPQRLFSLLFLVGALTLKEANQLERFCEDTRSRKGAIRFLLSIMRKKAHELDMLFRVVIDQHPELKKPIISSLRKQCKGVYGA